MSPEEDHQCVGDADSVMNEEQMNLLVDELTLENTKRANLLICGFLKSSLHGIRREI